MAIKDLFSKQKSQSQQFRGANKKSVDEFRQDVESGEEIKQIRIEDSLVVPDLDYASASNFVKYGSAKKYYADSIKRIYNQYPYDGSNAEKIKFKNDLTQLERYILDNEYPKSTGFAVFSPDGWGTNTGPTFDATFGKADTQEHIQFKSQIVNNVYDVSAGRQGNLHLNWESGSTIEFWMKMDAFPNAATQTNDVAVFQISGSDAGAGHELLLFIRRSVGNNYFNLQYGTYSGAAYSGKFGANIALNSLTTVADSTWHHYAFSFKLTTSTNLQIKTYVDGEFDVETNATVSGMPTAISGSLIGTLGALGNSNAGTFGVLGYGKLSGSIDEFRFWKTERNAQQIGRNYFTVVNGGTNTDNNKYNDDNPVDLGVYFKFNEGKTGTASTDSTVLDYSGRLSNGAWTGYVSNSRDTASAITQAGVGTEAGDPIIYATHPDVVTLSTNLEASGTQYDAENVGSLQDSMPLWILDEDNNSGGELSNLLQVMGSYLDSLYLQVAQIPKFHEANYQENNNVAANPHNNRLLTSLGFDVPEIFIDKQVLETITNQDDKRKFEDKLNEIKNLIYKNIYNNLTYINKSKGTTKSIRNLLRCYGVDDDLFNFNVYADQAQYFLEDDFKNSSIKFDSLDLTPFANTQNSEGVIYNFSETGNTNSSPYISGTTNSQLGFTVEANVIFPKTPSTYGDTVNLTDPAIVTASVFGVREAFDSTTTTVPTPDDANLTVRIIKEDNTAKFQLSSSIGSGILLESDRFYDVYDNSRWSLSVRLKNNAEPFGDAFAGKDYTIEFNGYNYIQDIQQNSFALTDTVVNATGALFVAADKRVYAGSERTNITGTLQHRSNMKLLSVLAWADYVEDTELKSHARDVTSFGRAQPYKNSFIYNGNLDSIYIPKFDTLAMNLAFNQVTSSDGSGKFTVPDLSSGSIDLINKYAADDYSKIVSIQNTAQGANFPASSDVKDIQYLNISTQQIPENLNTNNMIQILENDDDLFFLDNRPVKYFFSLEASMYDTISREMLKTFAGVLDYASMIGSPVVEYQVFNKELRLARENFYERVENNPDLEKYVSLYKFLDSAIESVLFNLMPASANSSDRVRTMVEGHIFERNSVLRPLPPGKKIDTGNTLNGKSLNPDAEDAMNPGVDIGGSFYDENDLGKPSDLTGGGKFDIIDVQTGISVSPTSFEVDLPDFGPFKSSKKPASKKGMTLDLNQFDKKSITNSIDTDGLNAYYKIRAKRTQADIALGEEGPQLARNSIHSALQRSKLLQKFRAGRIKGEFLGKQIGADDQSTRKSNVILPMIQGEGSNAIVLTKVSTPTPNADISKKFISFDVNNSSSTGDLDSVKLTQNNLPVKFTNAQESQFFGESSASINNLHIDTYYDSQKPLQGTFTEQHVGGYKHRHTQVGQTSDRPELYKVEAKSDTQVVIFSPRNNSSLSTHDFNIPRIKFSRNELIKKVYNTRNIKTITGSSDSAITRAIVGNFDKNYQIISTNGRKENNFAFVQANGFDVTGSESTAVSGNIDFALPDRTLRDGAYNETVIVNRFSSPGEVATLSEGYLDVEAAEYSPYNALPYRNRQAVNNLNNFLKIPSAFGGYESGSTVTASFHKVQRNRVDRIKQSSPGNTFTGSFEDNGFFSYQTPKKDFGYWWISSSADPDLSMDGLYGFATSSDGVTFLSGASRGDSEDTFINFAYYSADKIGTTGYHYEINENQNLIQAPTAYTDGTKPTSASIYFLNLNGPFGFPTYKQIRNAQHPVARYLRSNNFISSKTDGSTRVQHAPVSTKYKPIIHLLKSEEKVGDSNVVKDLILTYPFASEYDYYGDYYDTVNGKLTNVFDKNFKTVDKTDSLLYNISGLYTGKSVLNKVNTISLISLFYGETIYPKETNTYLSKARDRSRFVFNWRDSLDNRINQITGSQNSTNYSYWPMDINSTKDGELMDETSGSHASSLQVRYGRYRLSSSLTGYVNTAASSPQNTVQFGTNDSAGQGAFEDTYSEWNNDIRLIAKDHTIVPEYKISDHIAGIVSSGFDVANNTYQSLSLTGSKATSDNNDFLETYAHSDDIPAIEIVRETQEKDADRISINVSAVKKLLPYDGFYPVQRTLQLSTLFKDSLESNTTVRGADASFQTVNNTIFSRLTYGSIRAGVATDTAIWQSGTLFTETFTPAASASTAFEILDYLNVEGLKFAISSSLGHEWFTYDPGNTGYPGDGSEPTPFIIINDTDNATTVLNTQAIIAASSSVGIVSNRAGAILELTSSFDVDSLGNGNILYWQVDAIDNNYVTGSTFDLTGTVILDTVTAYTSSFAGGAEAVTDKSFNPTASWSRLPFETIISPSAYLNSNTSLIENDPENPFDSTASVSFVGGTYELAASNFYAGVIDTFIENKTLTTIKTSPQSQWSFSDATLNNYVMDVVVSKPDGFSNHDDPAANGAPYTAHACFYQPLNYSGAEWWTKHITNGSSSVNAEIPPAASWSENEAIVTINFDYNAFKTAVTERDKPNFGDILQYSTRTFKNKQMFDQLGATDATSTSSNSSQFMTIEAGVDLFNFDSNTEQWVINTKCEFPVHNVFDEEGNALDALYPDGTDGSTGTAAGDVNRGVWHQFSPLRESKLKLGVVGPDLTNNRESGSLAQACGFETEQKTISQIASSAKLKEYLVVIPFVTNECDEETFFHYPIDEFERAYAAIPTGNPQPTALATSAIQTRSTTLTDSLARQRELILPPTLSYMAKRDNLDKRLEQEDYGPILPPFAMYVFEVEQTLNQEDLSKWWQGVLPSAGEKATFEKFNISHDIKAGEIISPSVLNNDLFNGKLPKEMRFKIFKAKYRRNLTYNEVKNNSLYGDELVNSTIGYNYPHDFYSLIEMAKVDLGLEYEGKTVSTPQENLQNALSLLSEDEDG